MKTFELKQSLMNEIWDIVSKHGVTKLSAVDIDECSSPVIMEDHSDLEDHYTLDTLTVDNDSHVIEIDASGSYGSDTFELQNLPCEIVEGVLEWLKDNEDIL